MHPPWLPQPRRLQPPERYIMNHDPYSLDVVLLELGLWRPMAITGVMRLKNQSEENNVSGIARDFLKRLVVER